MATTVDAILEEIAELSIEDQEMVDDIVHRRVIEKKREEIRADYRLALKRHKNWQSMLMAVILYAGEPICHFYRLEIVQKIFTRKSHWLQGDKTEQLLNKLLFCSKKD